MRQAFTEGASPRGPPDYQSILEEETIEIQKVKDVDQEKAAASLESLTSCSSGQEEGEGLGFKENFTRKRKRENKYRSSKKPKKQTKKQTKGPRQGLRQGLRQRHRRTKRR
jgi:glucan-binding YG repeat protein